MTEDLNVTDVEIIEPQTEAVVEDVPFDVRAMVNPVRGTDEAYEDYIIRRRGANRAIKTYMQRGTPFHNSRPEPGKKGVTYVKAKA